MTKGNNYKTIKYNNVNRTIKKRGLHGCRSTVCLSWNRPQTRSSRRRGEGGGRRGLAFGCESGRTELSSAAKEGGKDKMLRRKGAYSEYSKVVTEAVPWSGG